MGLRARDRGTCEDPGVELTAAQAEAARVLHAAWLACPDQAIAGQLRSTMAIPGDVGLRTRYEAILASPKSGLPVEAFQLPWGVWMAQLAHMTEGDRQLSANRPDLARDAFSELALLHVDGLHPQPLIDAETGLGDAARQADDLDGAINHYKRASSLARRIHHRYAQVRVAIPLGYLLMRIGSSARALEQMATARKYAHEADWRLDEANALLGLGEAYARLRQPKTALAHDRQALSLFDALRSEPGRANALLQVAETCRRFGHPQFAREAYRRCLAACGDDSVAAVNARDGLAEVLIKARRARRRLRSSPRGAQHCWPRLSARSRARSQRVCQALLRPRGLDDSIRLLPSGRGGLRAPR